MYCLDVSIGNRELVPAIAVDCCIVTNIVMFPGHDDSGLSSTSRRVRSPHTLA